MQLLRVQCAPHFPWRHQLTTLIAFSFSDGVQAQLDAGLPPDVEPFFDLEERDLDGDFDEPVEGDPAEPQPQASAAELWLMRRPIKTYVVKHTAYRTLVSESCETHVLAANEQDAAYARSSGLFTSEK